MGFDAGGKELFYGFFDFFGDMLILRKI